MLIFRVSGIRTGIAETDGRHDDGIDQCAAQALGHAEPAACADTYAAVVITGTSPPPQPLPM